MAISPLDYFGNIVDNSQIELETKLKNDFGADFNHWYFSRENIGTIGNVLQIISFTAMEVNHLSPYKLMKHLIVYTILQKLNRLNKNELLFGSKVENLDFPPDYYVDLDDMAEKSKLYCKYAHGCYGDVMNYVYSGKDLTKILQITDYNEQFINHTKIDPKELLYSNWEATPYMPAHCITVSKERKEVILCLRGSSNWADVVTDLVFTYLNFSILEEENGNKFVKINYNMQVEKDLATSIQDTKHLNCHLPSVLDEEKQLIQNPGGKPKELFKGLAHSGIFIAGIELYQKLRPKVSIFYIFIFIIKFLFSLKQFLKLYPLIILL